jgi:hypothetical protein
MRNKIACAVSDVLSEPVLHKSVKTWYKRAGEEIQESIAAPDEDGTVHISVSCRRLDSIECFLSHDGMEGSVSLQHSGVRDCDAQAAHEYVQPFIAWLADQQKSPACMRRGAAIFHFSTNQQKTDDYWLLLNREYIGAGLQGAVMLYLERSFADSLSNSENRALWFNRAVETLGLGKEVVAKIKQKKITFQAQAPWNVEVREEDRTPERNPLWITIFSFDTWHALEATGTKYFKATKDKVVSIDLMADMLLPAYRSLLPSIPRQYEGWELGAFGWPSYEVRKWLKNKDNPRPPGRIPIGSAWEGGENDGFSYSVSVVETPEGPCIELGSDNATHEKLQSLSKYFEGLEFHPV